MGVLGIANPTGRSVSKQEQTARVLRSLDQLPPFSPVLSQLMASLAQDDVSFAKLSSVIERDTILSASVLRLVNSVLYGRRGTISSVRHAVAVIGTAKLRNYLFGLSVSRMWNKVKTPPGWSMANFNLHSVATAVLADLIVQKTSTEYPEGAFVAGLLHDIGRLMIAIGAPIEFTAITRAYEESDESWESIEERILGVSHPELSAEALKRWNLPEPIQRAVLVGASPCSPDEPICLPYVVATASLISDALGYGICEIDGQRAGIPGQVLEASRIPADFDTLIDAFEQDFNAMRASFS